MRERGAGAGGVLVCGERAKEAKMRPYARTGAFAMCKNVAVVNAAGEIAGQSKDFR